MNNNQNKDSLKWAERYARLLDARFKVPGTNFTFGIDPILGLIPGLGDGASLIFQMMLVFALLRHGSSGELRAKLILNVLLDSAIGSIPVIGQIWDFFFKANERNLRLTQEYLYQGRHQGNGRAIWVGVAVLLILTIALIVWVIVWFLNWVVGLF